TTRVGRPRLVAMMLPVPAGTMPSGTPVPSTAAAQAVTVPSPPQVSTRSAPAATARAAASCPGSAGVVSNPDARTASAATVGPIPWRRGSAAAPPRQPLRGLHTTPTCRARSPVKEVAPQHEVVRGRDSDEQRVEPVEHAAEPRQHDPRVLHAEVPLDKALDK